MKSCQQPDRSKYSRNPDDPPPPCSAIILAGGLNSRFGGKPKAFLEVGGTPILDRIYQVLRPRFDDLILVTNDPQAYLEWDLTIVTDLYPQRSSLTGIHAGLFYAQNPHAFVIACDTPFLQPGIVDLLRNRVDQRADIILPVTSAGNEPLCAIYARKSLPAMTHKLERRNFKIMQVFRRDRIKPVSEQRLREADPELCSFFNINTPEQLAQAEALVSAHSGHGQQSPESTP